MGRGLEANGAGVAVAARRTLTVGSRKPAVRGDLLDTGCRWHEEVDYRLRTQRPILRSGG
jgi:hypothetical protein